MNDGYDMILDEEIMIELSESESEQVMPYIHMAIGFLK
jgi:hypothetical protein